MAYWISQRTGRQLTSNQLHYCLKRNFSGRDDTDETIKKFLRNVSLDIFQFEQTADDDKVNIVNCCCFGNDVWATFIEVSLYFSWANQNQFAVGSLFYLWVKYFAFKLFTENAICRETRYLLFLTENYDALRILQQRKLLGHDPFILFGSSFPEDMNDTQVELCSI